jgi:hypothetical protein
MVLLKILVFNLVPSSNYLGPVLTNITELKCTDFIVSKCVFIASRYADCSNADCHYAERHCAHTTLDNKNVGRKDL